MKISAQLLVYNEEEIIRPCMENIYAWADQIVVGEGRYAENGLTNASSTDNTREILESFPDPQNKIIIEDNVGSEVDTKNNLISRADGDLLVFVCADERWYPSEMERLKFLLSSLDSDWHLCRVFAWTCYFSGEYGYWEDPAYVRKLSPDLHFIDRTMAENDEERPMRAPVSFWHGAYIGTERVRKKLELYGEEGSEYFNDVYLVGAGTNGPTNDSVLKMIEANRLRGVDDSVHMRYPGIRLSRANGIYSGVGLMDNLLDGYK